MTDKLPPEPFSKGWLENEANLARRRAASNVDATHLPADEWAKHFAAWLGRPEVDATVSKTLAALLAAVIAAHGQVSLTREQVIQNAHRPIQLRRTKAAVILFLGEPELTDEPDDDTG